MHHIVVLPVSYNKNKENLLFLLLFYCLDSKIKLN